MEELKAKLKELGGYIDNMFTFDDIKAYDTYNLHSKKYSLYLEILICEDKFTILYEGELFTFNCQKDGVTKLIDVLYALEINETNFDVYMIHALIEEVDGMEVSSVTLNYKNMVDDLKKDLIKRSVL